MLIFWGKTNRCPGWSKIVLSSCVISLPRLLRRTGKLMQCSNTTTIKFSSSSLNYAVDDFRRTFSAFTMDVIARCAFGLVIDSLGSDDDPFIKNADIHCNPLICKSPLILLPCKSTHWTIAFLLCCLEAWIVICSNAEYCFLWTAMYPGLLTKLGFADSLFVTEELRFCFKLLEDELANRLQSEDVYLLKTGATKTLSN